MNQKYLYALSIQGIQSFIFNTGRLKEIVGASELVEKITNNILSKLLSDAYEKKNIILSAAGNIRYLFNDENQCKSVVRMLPMKISEMAPGLTVSQTVIAVNEQMPLIRALEVADNNLKVQRNKLSILPHQGYMGIERARRTGDAGYKFNGDEVISKATDLKINNNKTNSLLKSFTGINEINDRQIAYDFTDLTGGNDWIAVIHADGNGLGQKLQKLSALLRDKDENVVKEVYQILSKGIDQATEQATQSAYNALNISDDKGKIPVRPAILGGDDITLIVRADLALAFTNKFLLEFHDNTKLQLRVLKDEYGIDIFENGLTASAGIAYTKSKYPIHYGLSLADDLCKDAKSKAKLYASDNKTEIPSTLAFYKVKDSFLESLDEIKKRTMMANDVDLYYGPYFTDDEKLPNTSMLYKKLDILTTNDQGVSSLRQWLSELYIDKSTATFLENRITQNDPKFIEQLLGNVFIDDGKTIISDLLTLYSFTKKTK